MSHLHYTAYNRVYINYHKFAITFIKTTVQMPLNIVEMLVQPRFLMKPYQSLLLLQAELGITSQRHFYRICRLFPSGRLLERSRFNRRSRQLIWLVQFIRKAMNDRINPNDIVIIDSFPLPLCQPVRNHRASIFKGVADIGYNASKERWFYGFKIHMLVTLSDYILNYVVTYASVHDIKIVHDLIGRVPTICYSRRFRLLKP